MTKKSKYLFILFLSFQCFCFSQGPNSWVKRNNFAGFKREQAVACTVGEKAYLGTGIDTAETVQDDWWEFDPNSDSWTQKANVPGGGRRCAVAFGLNDKAYVGTGINTPEAQDGFPMADFHEFNPLTNTWAAKANCPVNGGGGVYYSAYFVADNKGFIVGGKLGPSNYTNTVYEYKPAINQWVYRTIFPAGARYNMTSTALNGVAYIGLGTNFDTYMSDWYKYNPGSNTWEELTSFPGGDRAGSSAFASYGKVFVCLGTNGGPQGDLYEYNTLTNTWSPRANYGGSDRKQAVSFTIGNRAYVGTGSGSGGKKNTMYEYIPLAALSLEEHKSEISVFPNPSTDFIQFSTKYEGFDSFRIVDLHGKPIMENTVETDEKIDIRSIPNGTYFFNLKHTSGFETFPQQIQIIH